jgi:thiosulfate/3-mercaptopyruvate sulfurtransferase
MYATPHSIQRNTPRTEKCDNCHGNKDVFLTEDDLLPYEVKANQSVVVPESEIPKKRGR